ncbi:hypothetical protein SAMN04487931_11458 [Desulfobacula phenolica]|uniref:Uncharacterized protein n=1 Tax=Desulfobacula phenolica TaxID=90732 RepID=A0A1H2JR54_9BACT|nr:hypothetical protein SAMN04487931_11458 [Desulfobacula phenolica]
MSSPLTDMREGLCIEATANVPTPGSYQYRISRLPSGKPFQWGMPGEKVWVRSTNLFVIINRHTSLRVNSSEATLYNPGARIIHVIKSNEPAKTLKTFTPSPSELLSRIHFYTDC